MKPIVIIGAGITGCVIARELAKRGYRIILLEKETSVGGLAKTFHYGEFSFDIGPHRFFSQKPQITDFIRGVLKDDYATIARDSEVYLLGKYYLWPLRPAVLFNFPLITTLKSSWDLLLMIARNKKGGPDNFEDYILTNYGPSLYNVFFKGYTQKFLGLTPEKIHSEWAKEGMKRSIIDERIASRHLLDILKLFFIFNPPKTEFMYPVRGVGLFCDGLVNEAKEYGAEILTDSAITYIECRSGTIEEIFLKDRSIKPERIIWTGPLGTICNLLSLPWKGLEYLSLLLFNIEMKVPVNKNYQWCYYGSQDIIFNRVSITSSFSKNMAPEYMTGLCVEVTCHQGDKYWDDPGLLLERIKNDLIKVGLVSQIQDIGNTHIEKIHDAYPVYSLNYQEDVKKVKEDLSKIDNIMLAGRTGLFWYNNMDDCVENGLDTVENILLSKETFKKVEL
jgi:protoporphyrinogen oxidase